MSVMIIGASGRLGRALWASRPHGFEVTALTHAELDVTDIRAMEAVVAVARPDVVINAAAWTDVEGAQRNEARARAVNAQAPGAMGRLFARQGIRIVHFSTDYVFSGEGTDPWNEACLPQPRPAGVYGLTKREGERQLEESGVSGTIVRAGWLHSGERDFVNAILCAAAEGKPLSVTASQIGTPTSTEALAQWTWDALPMLTPFGRLTTVHYVEEGGWISRADMAVHVLVSAEEQAAGMGEFGLAARFKRARENMRRSVADNGLRPQNCRLSSLRKGEFPCTKGWKGGVDKSVDIVISAKKSLWITNEGNNKII